MRTPSGTQVQIDESAGAVRIRESGFHEVHVSGGGPHSLVFAANSLAQESNVEPLNVENFARAIVTRKPDRVGSSLVGSSEDDAKRSFDRAWGFILIACALLLVLETVLSNRVSKRFTVRRNHDAALRSAT